MTEPVWIYKWISADGVRHITTDYVEANAALHSHCLVLGSRYREPPPVNPTEEDFIL